MKLSRINGYALLTFFIGMFAYSVFNEKAFVIAIPIALIWLFNYDMKSYEYSNKRGTKHE